MFKSKSGNSTIKPFHSLIVPNGICTKFSKCSDEVKILFLDEIDFSKAKICNDFMITKGYGAHIILYCLVDHNDHIIFSSFKKMKKRKLSKVKRCFISVSKLDSGLSFAIKCFLSPKTTELPIYFLDKRTFQFLRNKISHDFINGKSLNLLFPGWDCDF